MQYKTNQLDKEVLFSFENYKNITQDFWVYKFVTTNPSYQYSLIDDIKQDLSNVKAVVYLQGKAFYALFEKSKFKNEFELENQIQKITKNLEEVKPTLITNLRDENEIDKRHLAQLLFNSLANTSNTENAKSSNITGGLYWVVEAINSKEDKEKNDKQRVIWQYITLKVELDYYLHIKLEVKTFSNFLMTGKMDFDKRVTKLKDLVQYEILPDNVRSMRRLKSSEQVIFRSEEEQEKLSEQQRKNDKVKASQTYIISQIDRKKSTVSFLDFSNYENFAVSKSGVLYEFLKEIKTQLNKYITVKFIALPFNEEKIEFDKQLSKSVKTRIENFYRSKPIVINIAKSLENDGKAIKLAKDLYSFLTDKDRDYKAPNVNLGDLQKDAINIRIIRNKDYYKNSNLVDEHLEDKNFIVQHITTDDFDVDIEKKTKKGEKLDALPEIDKILNEIYIKNDIKQGKITILDWTFGEWVFIDREEIKNEKESNTENQPKRYWYRVVKIFENGGLDFEIFENATEFKKYQKEVQKILPYLSGDDKHWEERAKFKGLVISNNGDINFIEDTQKFTIQEIETIGETLELESKLTVFSKNELIKLFNQFITQNSEFSKDEKWLNTFSNLVKYKEEITKDELNKLFENSGLNNRTKIKKEFCKFYYENSESILGRKDVLWHFFKGEEQMEELFASKTNVYYQINNETEAFYFVGVIPEQIQTDFTNATNIRKIKTVKNLQGQQSKLVFDQLLETMAVDFVKQGNLTVVPFPFKYLRESRQ